MKKLRIAIFFGGCSPEYTISLESAAAVLQNLDRTRYEPVPVGITREGEWFYYGGDTDAVRRDTWRRDKRCLPAVLSPNRNSHALLVFHGERAEALPLDAAFPVLHGTNGEDGTLQGLLELAGLPVVGCGVLASALCMDKDRAHKLAALAGVAVPRGVTLMREIPAQDVLEAASKIGVPLFVKPVRAGSSYGVSRVERMEDLPAAVERAFAYDSQVLLEEAVAGFEVGCAVLGTEQLMTGAVDEIALAGGFFDYTEKYTLKTAAIHVPARIPQEKAEEIQETAKAVYRALGCAGFARVDLFLTPDGHIVFNEVNTIPGFTGHSRYPAMMRAAGLEFPALLTRMIEEAVGG